MYPLLLKTSRNHMKSKEFKEINWLPIKERTTCRQKRYWTRYRYNYLFPTEIHIKLDHTWLWRHLSEKVS